LDGWTDPSENRCPRTRAGGFTLTTSTIRTSLTVAAPPGAAISLGVLY